MADKIPGPTDPTPPFNPNDNSNTPQPEQPSPTSPILEQSLHQSHKERMEKGSLFNTELNQKLSEIESKISSLSPLIHEYKELQAKVKREPTNEQLKVLLQEVSMKIENSLDEMNKEYKSIGFDGDLLEFIFSENYAFKDFIVLKEITLNRLYDSLAYKLELEANIQKMLPKILEELGPNSNIDSSTVTFSYQLNRGDSHNRGRTTAIGTFFVNNQPLLKAVYKPRDAHIDEAVVKTFHRINSLPSTEKSGPEDLPTYKIIRTDSFSIWEFIDGPRPHDHRAKSAYDFTSHFPQQKKLLRKKLNRMDAILTKMHVSDLHRENVIFHQLNTNDPIIVPIDLENVQHSAESRGSMLGGYPDSVELTKEELQIIEEFNQQFTNLPCRVLPMGTQALMLLTADFRQSEEATKQIMENCISDGYDLSISVTEMERLFLRDVLHSDVPYFSELKGMLYYGHPNENIVIGRRKK